MKPSRRASSPKRPRYRVIDSPIPALKFLGMGDSWRWTIEDRTAYNVARFSTREMAQRICRALNTSLPTGKAK